MEQKYDIIIVYDTHELKYTNVTYEINDTMLVIFRWNKEDVLLGKNYHPLIHIKHFSTYIFNSINYIENHK